MYPEAKIDSSFLQTLLNFPFACLFAQRGMLPIHASAVRYDKKTILFPGISKVGKSSLAASLIKNNGQLITEDIAAIKFSKNLAMLYPSYPLIKLSKDINQQMKISNQNPIKLERKDRERSMYPLDAKDFYCKKTTIDLIIFPEWGNKLNETLSPISKKESIIKLIAANFIMPAMKGINKDYLKKNKLIVDNAESFIYQRNRSFANLRNFCNLLQ